MKTRNLFLTAAICWSTCGALATDKPAPTPLITKSEDANLAVIESYKSRKDIADACRELAVIGTSKAVPVLVGLLAFPELHHMARYALETIPDQSVDAALRDELPRLTGRPLVGVIGSLGVRKDTKAVKPLTRLLNDSDPAVAQAASRALGQIGTASAAKAIEEALSTTAPANQLAFCEGLFRCAEAFIRQGNPVDAVLLYDRLRERTDLPPQVRAGALRAAIVTRKLAGLALLHESLMSDDGALFDGAVRASMEMNNPEVTGVLTARLPLLSPGRQIVVMQALGARHDDAAVRTLATLVRMGDIPTRVAAVHALAAIGSYGAVQAVAELIAYPIEDISTAAVDALAGMSGDATDAVVLNLLKNQSSDQRMIGIDLAGRRHLVAAVPALLVASADADAKIRASAVQKLGRLASTDEIPALLKQLSAATNEQDIAGLAEALGSICTRAGSPASTTAQIITVLTSAQPAQKAALLGVLSAVGGEKALVAVRGALADSNAEVHDAAVRALADWPDGTAAPELLQLARSGAGGSQREVALRGYVRLARESSAPPAEKLASLSEAMSLATSPSEKMLVLAGLGDITTVESLRLVTPQLSDPAVADEAGAVAVKIAAKLDAKDAAEIGKALNQVLKSAKSSQVLDQARKRLDELKLPVQ